MSGEQIAWLAGLIEGEGSFVATTRTLSVVSTDEDIIHRLRDTTGVGRIYRAARQQPHHKQAYLWNVGRSAHLRQLIPLLLPWLGERRTQAAATLLAALGSPAPAETSM
jgi:hypothetical protein